MKKIFLSILLLILSISIVNSSKIEVNVPEVLNGEISAFFLNKSLNSGVVKTKIEFDNIGSIPFKSRLRLEILEQEKLLYTLWSDGKEINPSEKKIFEFFTYINKTGFFKSRIRVYYGGEILDHDNTTFEIKNTKNPEDIFEIKRLRAYEDYIKFDIKSKKNVNNIIIMFSDYPKSWIIEQKKIESLKKNNRFPVKIKYIPVSWIDKEIRIHIFTEDGNFYKTENIILKNESGIKRLFNSILDFLLSFI